MTGTDSKVKSAKRIWGRMVNCSLPARIASLVFVAVGIAAMAFTQLAFFDIFVIDDKPVYVLLILAPIFLGAYLFGPFTGALLGLYAGGVLFVHSLVLPLDYYEVYFMTWLHTFVLLTALGGFAGWLFSLIERHFPERKVRLGVVALACVALSFAASGLMSICTIMYYSITTNATFERIGERLLNSPLAFTVQAAIDSVLAIVFCAAADVVIDWVEKGKTRRRLHLTFRSWMLLVSAIVFMVSSAIVFTVVTVQEQTEADTNMQSEADYLATQADSLDGDNYDILLNGYTTKLDGTVVILDNRGSILASNDTNRFPKGGYFTDLIGYPPDDPNIDRANYASIFYDPVVESHESVFLEAFTKNGAQSMDFEFLNVAKHDNGYTAIMRIDDMVYANRPVIMTIIALLTASLIAAIAALATVLLNRVIIRHIGETNGSLKKIAAGDLTERIEVHDSLEFSSLAEGINSTVVALSDMIDEVARRNEQDLATAKTIQESALPRKFPPFPDIDNFDIYASMKTAREVGGDFYDFFLVENAKKVAFVMADVSGKGIPAALFMMAARSQLRTYLEEGLPIDEAVASANHKLCEGNDADMFVTAWVGALEYETGELTFVNAGHNPPLLLHDGSWEWMRATSGLPLGMFDGVSYRPHTLELSTGDTLYTYTDGVTEAMDINEELYGEERLLSVLDSVKGATIEAVVDAVSDSLANYTQGAEQSDDITMLVLKYATHPSLSENAKTNALS